MGFPNPNEGIGHLGCFVGEMTERVSKALNEIVQ
jgi:hypothetical protein